MLTIASRTDFCAAFLAASLRVVRPLLAAEAAAVGYNPQQVACLDAQRLFEVPVSLPVCYLLFTFSSLGACCCCFFLIALLVCTGWVLLVALQFRLKPGPLLALPNGRPLPVPV
jgi:ABC-type microcin C transport system permease subunit YejE